jgi:Ca-activated chloride channel family protein
VQPALIRTYEFLDYHSFDCPPARDRALSEVARAYEAAFYTYNYRYLNRVVVISDGADNVSPEAEATIARHAEDSDRQGIYLAGIGGGEGLNDQLMNRFTDKGRGAYLFVDSSPAGG